MIPAKRILQTTFLVLLILSFAKADLAAAFQTKHRMIELEIRSDARSTVGIQQEWMQALQDVGADRVRIVTGKPTMPTVEETELSSTSILRISGSIEGGKLYLPGGSFKIRNKSGIRDLLTKLRDDGAKVALADKKAFGLTSEQLVSLHDTLAKPLNFSTKDVGALSAVDKISSLIGVQFPKDAAARAALNSNAVISEELIGISAGTALAVIVRPLGLVVEPKREQGKSLQIRIVATEASTENWPVGWPIDEPPFKIEPRLFEKLQLEIREFPLSDALDAIERRTKVPFFYDHNAMARHGIELAETKVTLVRKKVSFVVAMGKLLSQCKPLMKDELRVDENGKPFVWISTVRK